MNNRPEMANRQSTLYRFASDVDDAASGLHRFRDNLPRIATGITAIVGEFFAVKAALLHIHAAASSRRADPSFLARIDHDLALVFGTLKSTVGAVFDMFKRSYGLPYELVWDDLHHRLDHEEGFGLLARLKLYRDFLHSLLQVSERRRREASRELRAQIVLLSAAQERALRRNRRWLDSSASTPRPTPATPLPPMPGPAVDPSLSSSDEWDDLYPPRPMAPEPPLPMSPAYTSSSSDTMYSSHTSYSSNPPIPPRGPGHWSQDVFDGSHPCTPYRPSTFHEQSICYGNVDIHYPHHLARDGFQETLKIPFDENRLWVHFYWRHTDFRARILVVTRDAHGHAIFSCQQLTNLRMFRKGSTLQLCRARTGDGSFDLWARLNFLLHERMVLFYATFLAMKRQDERPLSSLRLIDDLVLHRDSLDLAADCEEPPFAGEIAHGQMLHTLRLLRDRPSGVVRLEACASRGPRRDVPIWTAFVTTYVARNDRDWPAYVPGTPGTVSLAALRPAPTVFLPGYVPPRNARNEWILPFTSRDDASMFIETWGQLCRSHDRSA